MQGHTIIVGGGVIGLTTARCLLRRGRRVTVLEAGRCADSASAGNAGITVPGHLPLLQPGLVRKAARWLLDPGAPLYIPPRFDPALWKWLWSFGRACSRRHVAFSMEQLARLGAEGPIAWRELRETEGIAADFRSVGSYNVFRTEAGRRRGEAEARLVGGSGFEVEVLGGDEMRARDAAFGDEVLGAVHHRQGGCLDPGRFLRELVEVVRLLGGEVHEQTPVAALHFAGGRCDGVELTDGRRLVGDEVVAAAGAWTSRLLADSGLRLPLQGGKGYHLDLQLDDAAAAAVPKVPWVSMEDHVAVTPLDGVLRLAGTIEFSGLNRTLVARRIRMLRRGAARCLRADLDALPGGGGWCGLRPCTADGLPVIGAAAEGLYVASGHATMGMTHGPLTGRLLAETICDGTPSIDISALSPNRFGHPWKFGNRLRRRQ